MKLSAILPEKELELLNKVKKEVPKTSVGRELMNNLLERLKRRGNLMVEMQGHYIKRVRLNLSSNYFDPKEKNLSIWVKPFVANGKYLMFNYRGANFRASDVFGNGINRVSL